MKQEWHRHQRHVLRDEAEHRRQRGQGKDRDGEEVHRQHREAFAALIAHQNHRHHHRYNRLHQRLLPGLAMADAIDRTDAESEHRRIEQRS